MRAGEAGLDSTSRTALIAAALLALIVLLAGGALAWRLFGAKERPFSASAGAAADAAGPERSVDIRSYAPVVAQVTPAVVTVRSERTAQQAQRRPFSEDPFFEDFFWRRFGVPIPSPPPRRGVGLGSGVVVHADGHIVTNYHVIEGSQGIEVELSDRRSFDASVLGIDPPSDLAVLKIDASALPTLALANSDTVRAGDVVLAVGNPLGVGQTVTMGIVSAKGRATGLGSGGFEDFIQTDAPINRGNSGGALVNTRGELIGINSQILSPSGGNIGIGFAIPANMARRVMDQLMDGGAVRRGMLGVTVQSLDSDLAAALGLDEVRGALVSEVQAGSPAEAAGLQRRDVIVEMSGEPVQDSNGLRNQVASTPPGTQVSLKVARDGETRTVTATLAELPKPSGDAPRAPGTGGESGYGLTVEPLTPALAERLGVKTARGVAVTRVAPGSAAEDAGIRPGDVIVEANRKPVRTAAELAEALRSAAEGPALLLVNRRGASLFLTLKGR